MNVSRALTALVTAAQDAGLPGREAEATARSGLDAGQLEPLEPPAPGNGAPLGLIRTDQGVIDAATGEVLDDDEPVSLEQRFFAATTILATIRQAAHSRLVTPWSVLGAVLARVTAEVPPHVVLPPLVGSDASLNLAVALVAGSGGGKSGAVSCAQDLIRMPQRFAQDIGPGSGEGLMMAFLERDPRHQDERPETQPSGAIGGRRGGPDRDGAGPRFAGHVRARREDDAHWWRGLDHRRRP